jgi:hypothetical protein
MDKLIKKLNKIFNNYSDQELLEINMDLNKLYKNLTKKRSVEEFVENYNKLITKKEFITFTKYSNIIDKEIATFTEHYLRRNITIIQSSIQDVLDNRHRILIKFATRY